MLFSDIFLTAAGSVERSGRACLIRVKNHAPQSSVMHKDLWHARAMVSILKQIIRTCFAVFGNNIRISRGLTCQQPIFRDFST
jgi:hypothetical protein